jgi:hypothetical protein
MHKLQSFLIGASMMIPARDRLHFCAQSRTDARHGTDRMLLLIDVSGIGIPCPAASYLRPNTHRSIAAAKHSHIMGKSDKGHMCHPSPSFIRGTCTVIDRGTSSTLICAGLKVCEHTIRAPFSTLIPTSSNERGSSYALTLTSGPARDTMSQALLVTDSLPVP